MKTKLGHIEEDFLACYEKITLNELLESSGIRESHYLPVLLLEPKPIKRYKIYSFLESFCKAIDNCEPEYREDFYKWEFQSDGFKYQILYNTKVKNDLEISDFDIEFVGLDLNIDIKVSLHNWLNYACTEVVNEKYYTK